MRKPGEMDGQITVFLSLILTCICALLGGLFASARLAGCGWYTQMALNSSLDSLMSNYHREAWEQYRIFFLEYETEEELARELESYLQAYEKEAPFYRLQEDAVVLSAPVHITDAGGYYLEEEILDYMKYGIWEQALSEDSMAVFTEDTKEAAAFSEIISSYQENGSRVLGLERALERIGKCLNAQEKYLNQCLEALSACSGGRFFRAAEALERELTKIPDLVARYEREAETLNRELASSDAMARGRREELKAGTWSVASGTIDRYDSYWTEEGERRREVQEIEVQAERNLQVVKRAVRRAEEIQEYLDSLEEEDDEEDDAEDSEEEREEALWQQVADVLAEYRRDERFQNTGIRDKKKMNVLESISRLAGTDLLELCLPEGSRVSGGMLETAGLVSGECLPGNGCGETRSFSERILLAAYHSEYFPSFLTAEEAGFCYEQEYILSGEISDRENLKQTVNRLIAVREAVNLLTLAGNQTLRKEAEALAVAITGAAGLSPLSGVVSVFIMTVWAFAEAVEDVKILLAGGRIPYLKSAADWKVSLSGLAEHGTGVWDLPAARNESESGLSYQDWLTLFVLLQDRTETACRQMDMIQMNLRKEQPGFLMRRCAFRIKADYSGQGPLRLVKRTAEQEY